MIPKKEIYLSSQEKNVLVEKVFLEKSDSPSSRIGTNQNFGILILTNKRLFYYNIGKGKTFLEVEKKLLPKTITKMTVDITKMTVDGIPIVGDVFTYLWDIGELTYEKLKNKLPNLDLYINDKESFVVNIHEISEIEKHGNYYHKMLGVLGYKKVYLKLKIINLNGIEETFCIYGVNPKHPTNAMRIVNIKKLYKKITQLKTENVYD